jgi:WD40 repeat protein
MSFVSVLERLQKLENPYPGLRPFEREEQHLFFGRDQQIAELLRLLEGNRFLAVVGVSGSGKSSLVRAGLLPALERASVGEASERWRMIVTHPAGTPFAGLAANLLNNRLDPVDLRRSSLGLVQVARQLPREETLLVVVDQFEELFRYKDREPVTEDAKQARQAAASEAAEFVQLLLTASREQPPVYIVLTMRSDYLGDCAEFRDLPETLNTCQYLVPRLTREQRKQAIEGPLGRTLISPSLVQRILNDAGDDPSQLPILQHALMCTWSEWRKSDPNQEDRIEIQHYETVGGFENALNQHADRLLKGVPEEIAATIFQRLTARGRGDREHRDPATLAELWALCAAWTPQQQSQVTEVVEHFRQGEATFLLPRDEELSDETYIDISHESLIRQWRKLRDEWLPRESKSAKTFLYLVERAANWKAGKGELLVGLDLTEATAWNRLRNQTTAWTNHYADQTALSTVLAFIAAGQVQERKRALRAKRSLWIAVGLALIFAVLAGTAWYERSRAKAGEKAADTARDEADKRRAEAETAKSEADVQRQRADQSRDKAEQEQANAEQLQGVALARQLAIESESLQKDPHVDAEIARLLATEAMQRLLGFEAQRTLRESLNLQPRQVALFAHRAPVNALAFSPDGRYLTTASGSVFADSAARIFELASGKEVARLARKKGISSTALSRDGRYLVTTNEDMITRILEVASGKEVQRFADTNTVSQAFLSPDGRYLATWREPKTARVFEVASGKEVAGLTDVENLAFSLDGRYFATGGYLVAGVFEAASGKEVATLKHHSRVSRVAFSPDDRYLATGSFDGTVSIFEIASGREAAHFAYEGELMIQTVDFSPDGRYLATTSVLENTVHVADVASGKEIAHLSHEGRVNAVTFSPDGQHVATASADQTARVFETVTGAEVAREMHRDEVDQVAFSADGHHVGTTSEDNTARVFEAVSSVEVARVMRQRGQAPPFLMWRGSTADGRFLATQERDQTVWVFEAVSGRTITHFLHPGRVEALTVARDGHYVATGSFVPNVAGSTGSVQVLEVTTGREFVLSRPSGVTAVAFSPDGRYLATGEVDGTAWIFEVAMGKAIAGFRGLSTITAVAFTPDGRCLAMASLSGTALFDFTRKKEVWHAPEEGGSHAIAFSPDGRYLASGGSGRIARILQARDGKEVARFTNQNDLHRLAFSPDGRHVATVGGENKAIVFEAATGKGVAEIATAAPLALQFIEGGRYLLVASEGPTLEAFIVRRHLLRSADLIADACSRLTRNLTQAEWRNYVGLEVPYHKTCSNLP